MSIGVGEIIIVGNPGNKINLLCDHHQYATHMSVICSAQTMAARFHFVVTVELHDSCLFHSEISAKENP